MKYTVRQQMRLGHVIPGGSWEVMDGEVVFCRSDSQANAHFLAYMLNHVPDSLLCNARQSLFQEAAE